MTSSFEYFAWGSGCVKRHRSPPVEESKQNTWLWMPPAQITASPPGP
ncbi:MAG: hypothetical protein AAB368_16815 [bacterium]